MSSQGSSTEVDGVLKQLAVTPNDDEGWRTFRNLVGNYVASQVRSMVRGEDVDDVVQEVFVRVVKQVQQGKAHDVSNAFGWLKRICLCVVIDYRRRLDTERRRLGPPIPLDETSIAPSHKQEYMTPDQLAIVAESARLSIAKLSPEEQQLYRAMLEGPPELDQLARTFGVSRATLAVRISRLKAKLVTSLAP